MRSDESFVRLDIERLSLGGEGIAHADGKVLFVAYTAPGDVVEAQLTETHKNFARAEITRVIQPSPDRITPPCLYHFQIPGVSGSSNTKQETRNPKRLFCGGCSWQHLNYEAQLEAKRALVQETLERIGGLRAVLVKPVLGMKDPWRYRNKVQVPVGWDGHDTITGFYAPGSHDIVPIDDCLVQPELSVNMIREVRECLERFHLRAYDAQRHQGWLRHILVRTAQERALLVFVTRTADFPHESDVITTLIKKFPQIAGIHQNVSPARSNVILGRQWRKLAGTDFIEEMLGSLRFRLSPGSFFQVNSLQAKVLYDETRRMAGQGDYLLDLYCGVGGITLWLANRFREVGGVDEVPSAIENAETNAQLNRIENARFIAQPVEEFVKALPRPQGLLCVTLDPPRSGCDPRVIQAILRLRPERVVYVSCDPGTLARDLALLVKGGFGVEEVQPVDLFPQTPHIETVVLLKCHSALLRR